jgi:hypothetical protein
MEANVLGTQQVVAVLQTLGDLDANRAKPCVILSAEFSVVW